MTTHESNFYCELDNVKLDPVDVISGAKPRCLGYNPHAPLGYFYDKYVHPKNWREVLSINPNLRLCLAHFGGDEWSKGGGEASDWVQEIIALTKEFLMFTPTSLALTLPKLKMLLVAFCAKTNIRI